MAAPTEEATASASPDGGRASDVDGAASEAEESPTPPVMRDPSPVREAPPGTEIIARRTGTSRTYATEEAGRFRTEVFSRPIHYLDEQGEWQRIDPRLKPDGASVTNAADAVDVTIANTAEAAEIAAVELADGGRVAFGLRGATAASAEVGSTSVTFDSIVPTVDMTLTSVAGGVKEEILLESPTSPRRFEFSLALEGLSAALGDDGGVQFRDASDALKAVIPPGWMRDASGVVRDAVEGGVVYTLTAGGKVLTVTLDDAWLDDPDRAWPVTVDPTIERTQNAGGGNGDTWIEQGVTSPGTRPSDTNLRIGTVSDKARWSLLKFQTLSKFSGHTITDAKLVLWNWDSQTCSAGAAVTEVRRNLPVEDGLNSWNTNDVTWGTKPSTTSVGGTTSDLSFGKANTCSSAALKFDMDQAVRNWSGAIGANDNWHNNGITVRAGSSDAIAQKAFSASESTGATGGEYTYRWPRFEVNWWAAPDAPSNRQPADAAVVTASRPMFKATYNDDDNQNASGEMRFALYGDGILVEPVGIVSGLANGEVASWQPTAALDSEKSYTWRVRGWDGANWSSSSWNTAPAWTITSDRSGPELTISSSSHPGGRWSNATAGSFSWSASDGAAGIDRYVWKVNTDPAYEPTSANDASGSATTYTASLVEGTSYLHVKALDNLGNATTQHFRVRVDTTAPGGTVVTSESHPDSTKTYPERSFVADWAAASDGAPALSGVAGYAVVIDTSASTVPSGKIQPHTRFSKVLDNGLRYLHVRPRDGAGNWGPVARYAVNIDDTSPPPSLALPPMGAPMAATGIVSAVAGTGDDGTSTGDGGDATAATLGLPRGIARDSAGNLYISEMASDRVRKVSRDGIITAFAGTGAHGYSGDGGPAIFATFTLPGDIVVDSEDNVYVADGSVIRRITPAGIISTYAGGGDSLNEGQSATGARLWGVYDLVVDRRDNLLVATGGADGRARIRRVDDAGIITTIAGGGESLEMGIPATSAQLGDVQALAVADDGTIYLYDYGRRYIRKVTPTGALQNVAGTGQHESTGDGGAASAAGVYLVKSLYVDIDDSLFVGEHMRIRRIAPDGVISSVAGTGGLGQQINGVPALATPIEGPYGFLIDETGDAFFAESYRPGLDDQVVRKITRLGAASLPPGRLLGMACACDSNSLGAASPSVLRGDPVNTATGAAVEMFSDISLPGTGVALSLTRTYNSADSTVGPLGPGWTHAYNARISVDAYGDVTVVGEDGQRAEFVRQPDGSFLADTGVRSKLSTTASGYELRTVEQRRIAFDPSGQLTSILDRHGNGVVLTYASGQLSTVTDDAGRVVTLTYAAGRLDRATLSDGRYVAYGYTDGKLISSRAMDGAVTTYGYDSSTGLLAWIKDPNSNYVMRNVYDPVTRRVTEQLDPTGNKTLFDWDPVTNTSTMTDPRGGEWVDVYVGRVIQSTTGPLGNTTAYQYDSDARVRAVTDARGNTTRMEYDDRGNLVRRVGPAPHGYVETFSYDAANNLLTATSPRGYTTTNTYDGAGRLESSTDPAEGTTAWTYDGATARVATVKDPRNKVTSFSYDQDGNLAAVTTPLGNKTAMSYDGFSRLRTETDPRGAVTGATAADYTTTFAYGDADRVRTVTDPRGNVTTYQYDGVGNTTGVTNDRQEITRFGYDEANRITTVTEPNQAVTTTAYNATGQISSITSPRGSKTSHEYDLAGRRISTTTPRGNVVGANAAAFTTTFEYDKADNLVVTDPPASGATTTAYDALNRPSVTTDPLGGTTTVAYDANGNLVSSTDTAGKSVFHAYDKVDRVVAVTDADERTTQYAYDRAGQLTARTTALGFTETWSYDDDGRMSARVDPRGNEEGADPAQYDWIYQYSRAGQLTKLTNPLGDATSWTYDGVGNTLTREDAKARTTTFVYDNLNRLNSVTAPSAATSTGYAYDSAGNLTARTDEKGRVTTYGYDDDRHLTSADTPGGRRWTQTFDEDGNPTVTTTAAGHATATANDGTITAGYDADGRLKSLDYSDATPDVAYDYDDAGRLTAMVDGAGTENYGYDNLNQLTSVSRGADTFTYGYSDGGQVRERTYPDAGAPSTYTFDDDGRMASVTDGRAQTTTYSYDAAGNLLKMALPLSNGHVEQRSYDRAGQLVSMENAAGSSIRSSFRVDRDSVGNPERVTTIRGAAATDEYFLYDARDRLNRVCYDEDCATADEFIRFAYDEVGNRTEQERSGVSNPGLTSYTYDADDRLLTATSSGVMTNYSYDPNGNMTSAGGDAMTYDLAGRMTSFTRAASTTGYSYDGTGNRLARTTNGVADRQYLWDQNNPLPQIAVERTGTGAALRSYLQGIDAISVTDTGSGAASYYHYDHLGSVADVTDSSGDPQWSYAYEPFGGERSTTQNSTTAASNFLRFTGELWDMSSGQYYLRARQYDASIGRFTATDPIPPQLDEPYVSAYAYVSNRPSVFVDPSGRIGILATIGIGAAVGAVVGGITYALGDDPTKTWGEGLASAGGGALVGAAVGAGALGAVRVGATAGARVGATAVARASSALAAGATLVSRTANALSTAARACLRRPAAPNTVLPKPAVTHSKLQNIVNDLYKGTTNPTRVGTGTTADAVRNELVTGQATGGTFHLQKAEQYSNALRGVLKQDLSYQDALVAQSLLDDLQRAMRGLP